MAFFYGVSMTFSMALFMSSSVYFSRVPAISVSIKGKERNVEKLNLIIVMLRSVYRHHNVNYDITKDKNVLEKGLAVAS